MSNGSCSSSSPNKRRLRLPADPPVPAVYRPLGLRLAAPAIAPRLFPGRSVSLAFRDRTDPGGRHSLRLRKMTTRRLFSAPMELVETPSIIRISEWMMRRS